MIPKINFDSCLDSKQKYLPAYVLLFYIMSRENTTNLMHFYDE